MQNQTNSKILNLWLVNQFEKEERFRQQDNRKKFWKPERFVTLDNKLPELAPTKKWANTSINHNLRQFLQHNDLPESGNPLNDHSIFEDSPILTEGWIMPISRYRVNPRRFMPHDNQIHYAKFECIFSCVNFDKENPICIDRNGSILDGAYRMYICAKLNEKEPWGRVYVRQYDFE